MTNLNRIRAAIFTEIDRLNGEEARENETSRGVMLGAFVDSVLKRTGRTRYHLAETLGMDVHLVDAIFDGIMPDDDIDDLILTAIARVIDYDANVLRLLMRREMVPARASTSAK